MYQNKSKNIIEKWCIEHYKVLVTGSVFWKSLDIKNANMFNENNLATFWGKVTESKVSTVNKRRDVHSAFLSLNPFVFKSFLSLK